MKNIYLSALLAGTTWFLMAAATPSQAITTQGDVQANIISSLSLTKVDTLDFGSVMSGATSGVIRIEPASGTRSVVSGGAALVTGGGENDGTFELDGAVGLDVVIDIPTSVSVTSGGDSMTVSNFSWTYNGGPPSNVDGPATLEVGGPYILSVGADLSVSANQPAGLYTGTYSVTVNYQ